MMTATQLKYARERVDAILSEKATALSNLRSKGFSDKDKLRALKRGAFRIDKHATHLCEAIVYVDAPEEMPYEEWRRREKALRDEASKIKDQLILGDQEEALKLIQKFRGD